MHKCTARAAGGTINRSKPGPATVFWRSKNEDDIRALSYFLVCCGARYIRCAICSLPRDLVTPDVRSAGQSLCDVDHTRAVPVCAAQAPVFQKFKTVTSGNARRRANP